MARYSFGVAVRSQEVSVLLSLSTLPLLMGMVTLKSFGKFWQEVGVGTEEVFRGDRLPLLTSPPAVADSPEREK